MAQKICRICLALGVKVFKLGISEAKCFIENIFKQSGFLQDLHENQYICFECKALLDKSYKFIRRVLTAQEILSHVVKENKMITPLCIKQIDRQIIGFNLVKDFKYIDIFITEDNDIKKEEKSNFQQQFECKTEYDDYMLDPLENPVDHNFVDKEVNIDFGVNFKDFTEMESKLDIKIPIDKNPFAIQYHTSFDNAIQYEYNKYVFEQVKEEILDKNETQLDKTPRHLDTAWKTTGAKQSTKKTANKVQPSRSSNRKTICARNRDVKIIKKSKRQKRGRKPKYSTIIDNSEAYDGCVDSSQQIQQPDVPKYPAKCDHCNYEAPNRTAHFHHYLLQHKDKKYPYARQTGKQFICQYCGLINTKKSRHIDHELTHGTVSNFRCSQCPKSFVNKHRLQKHTYRSHPLQMLECDYCGKMVKSRESLMIHIRAHTGERPFKCPFCGAGFAHRGNIRPHIRANHKKYLEQSDCAIKPNGKTFHKATNTQILAPENAMLSASEMIMHLSTVIET